MDIIQPILINIRVPLLAMNHFSMPIFIFTSSHLKSHHIGIL